MTLFEEIAAINNILGVFCYYEPDAPEARPIASYLENLDWDEWPVHDRVYAEEGIALFRRGLEELPGAAEDYSALFVGPAHLEAPPWGSVYLDSDRVLFGSSLLELRDFYRLNGISCGGREHEPEDHIGLLLLTVSGLASDKRDDLAKPLLSEHILPWGYRYCEKLNGAARHGLYKGLSVLMKDSFDYMKKSLALTVAERRLYI